MSWNLGQPALAHLRHLVLGTLKGGHEAIGTAAGRPPPRIAVSCLQQPQGLEACSTSYSTNTLCGSSCRHHSCRGGASCSAPSTTSRAASSTRPLLGHVSSSCSPLSGLRGAPHSTFATMALAGRGGRMLLARRLPTEPEPFEDEYDDDEYEDGEFVDLDEEDLLGDLGEVVDDDEWEILEEGCEDEAGEDEEVPLVPPPPPSLSPREDWRK